MPGAAGMLGASPGFTIPVDIPPFHFQPRRISVDWRRFSAIDVERVAREVDVAVLQEHIASITFCNLDGEQCPHCGQPADPVLLKVLRMAQLSIEYLLHCQERLGTNLAVHTQRLEAASAELASIQQQAAEQAVQLQVSKEESRRWKKLLAMQQPLLQAGPNTYCKCHLCDKAFMNSSFLQAHVQRRHTETTEKERRKMKQVEQMEAELEELKTKLREMQQQLEAEREVEKLHREQETERARQQEEEGRKYLERWKEEERTKLHEEIDGLKQFFLTAFKDMASRSNAMEGKLQELRAREVLESNLGTLRDDDTEEAWWQASGWTEQERMVGQIKLLSAGKAEVTQEVTKVEADEESAGNEEATQGGKHRLMKALRSNPNLLKRFRHILEEVLEEKLESMGVKRVTKGISTRTYKRLQGLVRLQQQQKAVKFPGLLHMRDELVRSLMGKVRRCKKPSSALPRQLSAIPAQSLKTPRSLRGSKPMTIPAAVGPEATVIPHPASWSRALSKHSPSRAPWGTMGTSRPHQVVPWQSLQMMHRRNTVRGYKLAAEKGSSSVTKSSSEVMLRGKQLSLSPVKPALSAVMPGDETDSDGSDLDSLEKTAGSGTAMSRTVRLLERCLDAVAQGQPSRVKLFPAGSLASPSTGQPAKKFQDFGGGKEIKTDVGRSEIN
ncbi:cilium assembly protein DZIP1L isoform 4-T8 [Guaruba guarouba]